MSQEYIYPALQSSNPSVGTNGAPAPTSSTEVAGINPGGNLQPLQTDASGNLLIAQNAPPPVITGSNTVSSAIDVMPSTNVKGYSSISIQTNITNTAGVTFYGSNDNSNWQPVQMGYQAIGVPTTVAFSNNIFYTPVDFEFFKVTVTSYVNGTVTATWIISPATVGDPNLRSVSINGSTSPLQVDIHDSANNNITSTGGGLDVNLLSSTITLPVSAASLPLPTGAATLASQTNVQSAPGTPQTVALTVQGNASGVALPVSAASLPLPSGAASAANQTSVQSAPGTPQTVAITVQGNASGVALPVTATLSGTSDVNLSKVGGAAITEGQKAMSASLPVVIASDQSAVPVSAASLPLPSGAATSALQSGVQSAPGTPQTVAITVQGNASGVALPVTLSAASQPINTNGSIVNTTLTSTTATAATAPANAVGFIVEASSGNSDNIRWCIGGTSSASVGMRLEPGRDSGFVPCKATVSICAEASTTSNAFQLQWILSS